MLLLTLFLGGAVSTTVRAQETAATEPSVADRQAAGQAYDRATAAYTGRDYGRAATLFETAYRLAPAPAALVQAVRAHERAGNALRAASLALQLQGNYASDERAQTQARETLATAGANYARIDVTCSSSCTLELDGALQGHRSFFIEPGTSHTLRATFETGSVDQPVTGAAGQRNAVTLNAPPPVEGAETTSEDGSTTPAVDQGGVSPALFITGLVLTVGSGAVLAWSGVDTLDGVPAYRNTPTPAGLADGQSRELRTNVLIGVTAGLAVTTLILALVTDWDGTPSSSDDTNVSASIALTPDLFAIGVSGSFR